MFVHSTKIRVRYGETDQMGYMYYGNYAEFYEVGRVEMLRSLGLSYRGMEEFGVMMPVLELHTRYIKPARYDEEITVKVTVEKMPATRIVFKYELFNETGTLINTAETLLIFVNIQSGRPVMAPQYFLDKMQAFFD
ncbi:thioesterase family protein [uncultured Mucilaginibacter sp.]|uniref:acyl-CoA thioesterase n=1 Tax=uncultured Mucilaginibacter sp. TaxID=797541 RepID=UPI0025EB168B|nr:thioesterase family protein [uncultured Mucilaginibacter sp.]